MIKSYFLQILIDHYQFLAHLSAVFNTLLLPGVNSDVYHSQDYRTFPGVQILFLTAMQIYTWQCQSVRALCKVSTMILSILQNKVRKNEHMNLKSSQLECIRV